MQARNILYEVKNSTEDIKKFGGRVPLDVVKRQGKFPRHRQNELQQLS